MLYFIILIVFFIFAFFMAVVFRAKELKARKSHGQSFCCGKCGTCEKGLPARPVV